IPDAGLIAKSRASCGESWLIASAAPFETRTLLTRSLAQSSSKLARDGEKSCLVLLLAGIAPQSRRSSMLWWMCGSSAMQVIGGGMAWLVDRQISAARQLDRG